MWWGSNVLAKALETGRREAATDLRAVENTRLDALLQVLWDAAITRGISTVGLS